MNRLACLGLLAVAVWTAATNSSPADLILYTAALDGPSEATPNTSPGVGFATVGYDPVAHYLAVSAVFGDLIGTTTAAHIHGPTALPFEGAAGVATMTPTFLGFPSGVTAGAYAETFDTTLDATYNPAFLSANGGTAAGAEAALAASLAGGTAYFNIHTSAFGGGEIRGFLKPVVGPVPEPSSVVLLGLGGTLGLVGYTWRRRRR